MSDDSFLRTSQEPAEPSSGSEFLAGAAREPDAPPQLYDPRLAGFEDEDEGGLDLRRYLYAALRYKWLLVAAVAVGLAGVVAAWRFAPLQYTAEGNLWVEVEPQTSSRADVTPIRAGGLLESNAWIELLRSYAVLDSVVVSERLYVEAPGEYREAFEGLELAETFMPGRFELRVGDDGRAVALRTGEGALIEQGAVGRPLGAEVGFRWTPPPGVFRPGEEVPFTVLHPRDAARRLSDRLVTRIDQEGNFIRLSLTGPDPERLASVLNTLMDRHVRLAAELKRSKLDETVAILEEQLRFTEAELAEAEQDLEEFRVNTITLPSDQSTPIAPGLELTRDPVFDNYFDMQVELETVRRDRQRLAELVAGLGASGVRIEALESIPAVMASSEMDALLGDLVAARADLRALRERYSDDFPPVRELIQRINTLERESIPQVARGILAQLEVRENQARTLLDSASAELTAIPPRTIEEGRLRRRVTITGNLYDDIRSRVETARLAVASSIPDVQVLDRAAVPQVPSQDNRIRFAGLIFLACIGGGVGGAILLDRVDGRFRYAADVHRQFGLDILGSIPRIETGRRGRGAVNSAQALEAFRELRIHLGFAYGTAGPLTVAISSPSASEGKSLIAANLAVSFAEIGRRTLLLDGDTRRGDAHRLLGRDRAPGLVDYLRSRSGRDIIQATDIENLDFIGSGSRGASTPELLASNRFALFLGTLKRSYDVVIVDCPPLGAGGDAVILSSLVGNMALVIRTGETEKQLTQAKLDQLQRLPIRVLGAILNDVDPTRGYDAYYYTTYLPDYQPVPEGEDEDGVQLLSTHGSRS